MVSAAGSPCPTSGIPWTPAQPSGRSGTGTRPGRPSRMLSYTAAGWLRSTPGTARRYEVHAETLEIADDLRLAAPIEGEVRLASTGRSILATAELTTALDERCSRCLAPGVTPVHVSLQEEALPSIDIDTGLPVDTAAEPDALRLDDHHAPGPQETGPAA